MHRDGPRKTQWNLSNFRFWLASLLDHPTRIICGDHRPIFEFDDRKTFLSSDNMSDRAVHVSCFEIIFDEHHTGSDFQNESFWGETSFFQCFDKFLRSLRVHFEDENIARNIIEFFFIIGINRDISREEFRVIFSFDSYISTFEEVS